MQLSRRRVEIAGVTPNPNAQWVQQVARNLTDYEDGFLRDVKYLLLDRDTNFDTLRGVLEGSDTKEAQLPVQSPNLNAHIERFMLTLKSECLERMIFFGERSLRKALTEYVAHYHEERNHQGLQNKIIEPGEEVGRVTGDIQSRNRLGGMLRYYFREAA